MVKFTLNLYTHLKQELSLIAVDSINSLQIAERSYLTIVSSLIKLKAFILEYDFKNSAEEINFFKEIKPQFMRELIYYGELYEIEARLPFGGKLQLRQYYEQEIERIRLYFLRHQDLYNYLRTGKIGRDDFFFLRLKDEHLNSGDNPVDIDNRFSTVQSYRLSKLQGFEMVNEFLQRRIHKMDNPNLNQADGDERKFSNAWTDSKAALIELAYALQARGAINNGKSDIRQIITDLEIVFNVELGNVYRAFQNMRIRKKNTTPFLDGLKESLVKKMDEGY